MLSNHYLSRIFNSIWVCNRHGRQNITSMCSANSSQIIRSWIITRDQLIHYWSINPIIVTLGWRYQCTSPCHLPHHLPKGSIIMNISVILLGKLAKIANSTVFFRHSNLLKYGPELILFTPFFPLYLLYLLFPIIHCMLLLMYLRIDYTCNDQLRVRVCTELLILRQLFDDRPLYILMV